MKIKLLFFGLSIVCFGSCSHVQPKRSPGYSVRWLGTAGWKMDYAGKTILIDPYLSRSSLKNSRGKEDRTLTWKSDPVSIEWALRTAQISRVDGIFVSHSHFDHMADVPYLLKRFPLATVYGSATTCNILQFTNPEAKCIDFSGLKQVTASGMEVKVIRSIHGTYGPEKRVYLPGAIDTPPKKPLKVNEYLVGGCFIFYFRGEGIDFLYNGSPNFLEKELVGIRPKVAAIVPKMGDNYQNRILEVLQPEQVLLGHFDEFLLPYSAGMIPLNKKELEQFIQFAKELHSSIQVTVPKFFEEISLHD